MPVDVVAVNVGGAGASQTSGCVLGLRVLPEYRDPQARRLDLVSAAT
jgi:hypothetical protein